MNKRIMIIDDDKDFLAELKETLVLGGYDIIVAEDPFSALELAKNGKPDVLLIDLKMPYKSGFQLASELKSHSELEHIPVIAMTAFFQDNYDQLMNFCGIHKCLKKPFNPLDVIALIEEELANTQENL